jgi:hypothetical protein
MEIESTKEATIDNNKDENAFDELRNRLETVKENISEAEDRVKILT